MKHNRGCTWQITGMLLFCLLVTAWGRAASFSDQFFDPEDGMFDASSWLQDNAYGFLPVPVLITEPAVDGGLGVMGIFFHEEDEEAQKRLSSLRESESDGAKYILPPSVTAVGGFYTGNDSWVGFLGHMGIWKKDSYRYKGAVGRSSFNLSYYGIEDNPLLGRDSIDFVADGAFIFQELKRRVGGSNFFAGANYLYYRSDVTLDLPAALPGYGPSPNFESDSAALGAVVSYDTRNNIFTPKNGTDTTLEINYNHPTVGSDFDFTTIKFSTHNYFPLTKELLIAGRFESESISGDVAFWQLPYVEMRGIPLMRYQGKDMALLEGELQYAFTDRWTGVLFGGIAKAADSFDSITASRSLVTKGLGFRYTVARRLGLDGGIDIAKGPEDWIFYITFGSPW